jgi:hypothetical protein
MWDSLKNFAYNLLPNSVLLTFLSIYNFFYDGAIFVQYKKNQIADFYEIGSYTFEDPVYYIYEDKFIPVRIYNPSKAPVSAVPKYVYYPQKRMLSSFAAENLSKHKADWIGATVHEEESPNTTYDITDWIGEFEVWLHKDHTHVHSHGIVHPFWVLQCWALSQNVSLEPNKTYVITCMDDTLENKTYKIRNGTILEDA